MENQKTKVIVRGKEFELLPATEDELRREGLTNECNCGDDFCSSTGYLWVCSLARDNKCRWFPSPVRCNQ